VVVPLSGRELQNATLDTNHHVATVLLGPGLQPESGRRFSARGSGLHSARYSGLVQPGTPEADKIQEWDGNLLLLAVGNGQKTGEIMCCFTLGHVCV
jgi:hypothetical protein